MNRTTIYNGNSNKMAAILFWFPVVLDKIATILFKTGQHWKTEGYHWNSKHVRYFSPQCIQIIIIGYHRKSLVRRVWWFSVIRTSFDGFGKWLIHGVDRQHTYVEAVGWVRPDSAASQEVLVEVDEQLVQLGRVLDTNKTKCYRKFINDVKQIWTFSEFLLYSMHRNRSKPRTSIQ